MTNICPDLVCVVHLESSRQFADYFFSIPNVLRVNGTLTSAACSTLVLHIVHLEMILEYMVTIHNSSLY